MSHIRHTLVTHFSCRYYEVNTQHSITILLKSRGTNDYSYNSSFNRPPELLASAASTASISSASASASASASTSTSASTPIETSAPTSGSESASTSTSASTSRPVVCGDPC